MVPPGGTSLFKWPGFAGMHEFCKRNRGALGRNWLCKKTPNRSDGLHDVSMPDDLQLWNNAIGGGRETTRGVLAPSARAAAHQFHKKFPQVSSMCVSVHPEASDGNIMRWHWSRSCSAQWLIRWEKLIGSWNAWWAAVGAEACREHGGSSCSGRAAILLFVSPLRPRQKQSDTLT